MRELAARLTIESNGYESGQSSGVISRDDAGLREV